MAARVVEGLIGVPSPREIDRYMSRSVRMPLALSSQHFEDTYPLNSSTKEWITLQPVVGQRQDMVRWNPHVEGNRMV